MFDDQPLNSNLGQPPSNLPVGEPEDIFAGTDNDASAAASSPAADFVDRTPAEPPREAGYSARPSAVQAGQLRPKEPVTASPAVGESLPPAAGGPKSDFSLSPEDAEQEEAPIAPAYGSEAILEPSLNDTQLNYGGSAAPESQETYRLAKPIFGRAVISVLAIIIALGIIGGGGWWIYSAFIADNGNESEVFELNGKVDGSASQNENNALITPPAVTEINSESIDSQILFGEPVDNDEDGLDNELEKTANTDPDNWDTDGDGLGDGEEISVWETDPLNPDTDGDTYPDGHEIKSGYSPTGPGKLLVPPTTTPE